MKGKTADEAKRNETETRNEGNEGREKQAMKLDNTKWNQTGRDEKRRQRPQQSHRGKRGKDEGEGKTGGQAGAGTG